MEKIIAYFLKFARLVVFLLLLAFAARNTEQVTVQFFLGHFWQLPLSLLLFIFFALGACLALLACLARTYRDRREMAALRAQIGRQAAEDVVKSPPREAAI